jgi:hypothetical protein
LCDLLAQRVGLHEVRERALAVDLDDGEPLAIPRLELGVACDVHLLQLEPDVVPRGLDDAKRGRAEVTALRVVDDDPGYG